MAILPLYIGSNVFAVYGTGATSPINGIVIPSETRWATIYQLGNMSWPSPQTGDVVIYKETGVDCRLAYTGTTGTGIYTIVKQDAIIATKEIPPVAP